MNTTVLKCVDNTFFYSEEMEKIFFIKKAKKKKTHTHTHTHTDTHKHTHTHTHTQIPYIQ